MKASMKLNHRLSSLFVPLGTAVLASTLFSACSSSDGDGGADSEVPEYTATAGPTTGLDMPPPEIGKKYTTASGLEYEAVILGTGERPTKFSTVRVHYHGYLPNGTVFDSSVQRGEPAVFGLNQVIKGWTEGVQLMREGAKFRFRIPHYLAYGEQGSPPKIGPRQTLLFEIDLIEIVQ